MIKYGDIFSGISCPLFALKQYLKYNISYEFACEINKTGQRFLKENHSPKVLYPDATKLPETLPKLDLFTAGFPCQPFSSANKSETRGLNHHAVDYFKYCIEVIKKSEPKLFILENVAGLTWANNERFYLEVVTALNGLNDYVWDKKIMNAKDYGATHSRNRIFFVGIRKEINMKPKFPEQLPIKNPLNELDSDAVWEIADEEYYDIHNKNLPTEPGIFCLKKQWGIHAKKLTETSHHYAFLTSQPQYHLLRVSEENIREVRSLTNEECCRIFGLSHKIVSMEKYNMASLLGNGICVNLLMKLLHENINVII